jgi:transcriptional regulator with XRE-family HTH domain
LSTNRLVKSQIGDTRTNIVTTDTPNYASEPFASRFGRFCRLKREQLGMRQVKVAELAFGSPTDQKNYTKIENGHRKQLPASTIRVLTEVLDIQPWEIALMKEGHSAEQVLSWGRRSAALPSPIEHLHSRSAFISRLTSQLAKAETFRAQITGPFFCHPERYFRLKASEIQYPDFDKELKERLGGLVSRTTNIRLIISNSERYLEKVRARTSITERDDFFRECLRGVDQIWGKDNTKGPDLCCSYLGSIHIPYIFDDSVLIQHRSNPMAPTVGGDFVSESALVEMERNRFDSIFDSNSVGQSGEINKLRIFFEAQLR